MARILSMKQVCDLTSLSRASINRYVEAGTFPEPDDIGDRKLSKPRKDGRPGQMNGRIGWWDETVMEWVAARRKRRSS